MKLDEIYHLVDQLSSRDLKTLGDYIEQRRFVSVWQVSSDAIGKIEVIMQPTHELTATMAEDEINAVIDEAIEEVRERRNAPQ